MTNGKNRRPTGKSLSIWLSPDRLSFRMSDCTVEGASAHYARSLRGGSEEVSIRFSDRLEPSENISRGLAKCVEMTGWNDWPVRVMLDTRKTLLIPETLFDPGQVPDYLKINNIDVSPGESVVMSRLSAGSVFSDAIMVYDKEAVGTVTEVFGANAWFASVFDTANAYSGLKHKKKDAGGVFTTLFLTGSNVYITVQSVSSGDWQYCEILPYSSSVDILYYMQELSGCFEISQTPVYVAGDGSGEICRLLRDHYKRARCE